MHAALEGAEQDDQSRNPGLQLHPGASMGCVSMGMTHLRKKWVFGYQWHLRAAGTTWRGTHRFPNGWKNACRFVLPDFLWEHSASVIPKRRTQVFSQREWEWGDNSTQAFFRYPDQFCWRGQNTQVTLLFKHKTTRVFLWRFGLFAHF